MMEWFFWPTRVSYANDPVGTALVGIVALLFGVGLGARLPRGRLRTALWVLPPLALAAEALAFAIEDAVKSSKMEEDKFLGLICGE